LEYSGEWKKGEMAGEGIKYEENGKIIYDNIEY